VGLLLAFFPPFFIRSIYSEDKKDLVLEAWVISAGGKLPIFRGGEISNLWKIHMGQSAPFSKVPSLLNDFVEKGGKPFGDVKLPT